MIGRQVGRYRIDARIGEGGMGVVYRGTQVTLDRAVAIKMLAAHVSDAENRERFRREALTLARLDHPNIVRIHDVEEEEGSSFIVMEYVGGGSLGDLLGSRGPLPPTRAAAIMAPVLGALQAAHLAGVVHRDIKPDNILFSDTGQPKLTDFGIAHMKGGSSRTRTGVMLGTPYYMSPEQALGRPVTPAADLYAVGVVLYEMLAGRVPFTGDDPVSVALQHVQGELTPLDQLRPDLPSALCDLVHRAMARKPGQRFPSAASMQDALEAGGWTLRRNTLDGEAAVVPGGLPPRATPTGGRSGAGSPPAGWGSGTPVPPPVPDDVSQDPRGVGNPAGTAAAEATKGWTGGRVSGGARGMGASGDAAPAAGQSGGRRIPAPVEELGRVARTGASGVGRMLAAPAWRGFPVAFWVGAGILVAALAVPLVGALAGGGGASPAASSASSGTSGRISSPDPGGLPGVLPRGVEPAPGREVEVPGVIGGGGGGGAAGGGGGVLPSARTPSAALRRSGPTRTLTPEESRALAALAGTATPDAPGPTPGSTPGSTASPGSTATPGAGIVRPARPGGVTPVPGADPGSRGATPTPPTSTPRTPGASAEAEAREAISSVVLRQGRALETRDRSLFLGDVHPSRRAEAGELFDEVVSPFSAISTEIRNLRVTLQGPDLARADYLVRLTLTLTGGEGVVELEEEESWTLTREGGRWWILDW